MDQPGILSSDRIPWPWILAAAGAVLFIPFIGGVHLFDWDEVNFAEISREMIMTGDYLNIRVDYKPFFEKPPFFFWLQAACMKIFGINEFAARLPNAIAGMIVPVLLYKTGRMWINRRFGVLWAISYMGSILPALYHKSGIIDPWFNLFIFSSIISWIQGTRDSGKGVRWFALSGVLSGLAVLTKGPVGPLLIGLTLLIMRLGSKDKKYLGLKNASLFILGNIAVAGIWFSINWLANGPDFILAFLKYQAELLTESVAGHKGFPGYHFTVLLFGVFPASLFALGALTRRQRSEDREQNRLRLLMIILLAVVVVVFSVVQSKIVHYSSLAYYPLSFLAAWTISRHLDGKYRWPAWGLAIAVCVTVIILATLLVLPTAGMHIEKLKSSLVLDTFTAAILEADIKWGMQEYIPALALLTLLFFFIYCWKKKMKETALIVLFAGIPVFVNIGLLFFIAKIEGYSQRALVEFSKLHEGREVQIKTIGFKSYIPYFYAQKPIPGAAKPAEEQPHYYLLKAGKKDRLEEFPGLDILYEKNGYIFLSER